MHESVSWFDGSGIFAALFGICLLSPLSALELSLSTCFRWFDKVREFSLSIVVPTIGMSLDPCNKLGDNTPVVVREIHKADVCKGVCVGDTISKINGVGVAGATYQG